MTLAELEALPEGAVILLNGTAYQKDAYWFEASGWNRPLSSWAIDQIAKAGGATIIVLWKGEA